ncbi:MAG: hypothetical protein LBO77_04490, partial [Desulfovibrio sp.]|nr:hypothetical protein [Desulfovibrio sp.]
MSVTLDAFINRAQETSGRSKLDLKNGTVHAKGTNFLSRLFRDMTGQPEANRATIHGFIEAIRAEHGNYIADDIARFSVFSHALAKGKPLTSGMVREAAEVMRGEISNVRSFNEGQIQNFRTDKSADGLEALVRERAEAKGMDWFSNTRLYVENLVRTVTISTNEPLGVDALRSAFTVSIDAELDSAHECAAQNQLAYSQYLEQEEELIGTALATPLAKSLLINGEPTTITLSKHFTEALLAPLKEAARNQVRDYAQDQEPVNPGRMNELLTTCLGFKSTLPPDPVLIYGLEHHAATVGLELSPLQQERLQGLAVLYGMRTPEGLETGLALSRELSGLLPELAALENPVRTLDILRDTVSAVNSVPAGAESMEAVIGFAFKSAMEIGNADKQVAEQIFQRLCNGPAVDPLEGALAAWGARLNDTRSDSARMLSGLSGAHLALRTAAREAAGLRRQDQSGAAVDLRMGTPAQITDIPDAVLGKMYMLGAPCGTTEAHRDPIRLLFARMTPGMAGSIIKAFQGMDMKHPLVALAFHNILEQGAEGFSLARLY